MLVAIHQPNFFPWLGFFGKWARADKLILLDDVQFPKTGGGTWTNRCKIVNRGKEAWLTLPIRRDFTGTRLVSEIDIHEPDRTQEQLLFKLRNAYCDFDYYQPYALNLSKLFSVMGESLVEFNLATLKSLGELIGLPTDKLELASTYSISSFGTQRLCELVAAAGGDAYLSGGGATSYQDPSEFQRHGIELVMQSYIPQQYPQVGAPSFISGLSVLDCLFNVGAERAQGLVKGQDK